MEKRGKEITPQCTNLILASFFRKAGSEYLGDESFYLTKLGKNCG